VAAETVQVETPTIADNLDVDTLDLYPREDGLWDFVSRSTKGRRCICRKATVSQGHLFLSEGPEWRIQPQDVVVIHEDPLTDEKLAEILKERRG
jgi:hypothetical protein